jgi:hypothetical protein
MSYFRHFIQDYTSDIVVSLTVETGAKVNFFTAFMPEKKYPGK